MTNEEFIDKLAELCLAYSRYCDHHEAIVLLRLRTIRNELVSEHTELKEIERIYELCQSEGRV